MDWLAFLLFRFSGFISLLPQNVPDLQFALQRMPVLEEKCEWIRSSRINPFVKFNAFEREQVLASLTQSEEELTLEDLSKSLGEYFWSNHGRFLHLHIARSDNTSSAGTRRLSA